MADLRPPTDAQLKKLVSQMVTNITVEEAFVVALSDMLQQMRDRMPADEAKGMSDLIRKHRVGIIKQRAIMGALGIDV